MKTTNEIFENFNKWLDAKNSKIHPDLIKYKGYLPPDEQFGVYRPLQKQLPNEYIPYPIQQVEDEIKDLVNNIVSKLDKFDIAAEIGMGAFGGTHILWKEIFDTVYTIELQSSVVDKFKNTNILDNKSHIICGNSHDFMTVGMIPDNIDFLFIDGGHSYKDVHDDFMLFESKVRKGGIIGFHDSKSPKYGINIFLQQLESKYTINYLHHSIEVGIAYLQK